MRYQLLLQVLLVVVGITVAELLREPQLTSTPMSDTLSAPSDSEAVTPEPEPVAQLAPAPRAEQVAADAPASTRLQALERTVKGLIRRLDVRADASLPPPVQLTALLAPGVNPEQVVQFRALQRASERLAHTELLEHRTAEALDSLPGSLSEDERSAVLFATGRAWGRLLEAFESERARPSGLTTRKAAYASMRADFRSAIAKATTDAQADAITDRLAQEIGLTPSRFIDHDSDGQ